MSSPLSTPITNTDDVINSRDVADRLGALTLARTAVIYTGGWDGWEPLSTEDRTELDALERLENAGFDMFENWGDGTILIRDSALPDYAESLLSDWDGAAGGVLRSGDWPFRHIDWVEAARELKLTYGRVDFAGVTYWGRA